MAHGKKYREAVALIDRTRAYGPAEAVDLVKQTSVVNFDPSAISEACPARPNPVTSVTACAPPAA